MPNEHEVYEGHYSRHCQPGDVVEFVVSHTRPDLYPVRQVRTIDERFGDDRGLNGCDARYIIHGKERSVKGLGAWLKSKGL